MLKLLSTKVGLFNPNFAAVPISNEKTAIPVIDGGAFH
jgi:hypothetical protein